MFTAKVTIALFGCNAAKSKLLKKVLRSKVCLIKVCVSTSFMNKEYINRSPCTDIVVPKENLLQYLRRKTEPFQDRVALVCSETGEEHRYGDLWERVERVASAFARRGISKGTTVALVTPNCPEFAIAFLAASATGATVTTVNCHYTADEMSRQFLNSEASVMVYHPSVEGTALGAAHLCRDRIRLLLSTHPANQKESTPLQALYEDDGLAYPKDTQINPSEDVLVLPYSSGTTGLPKGVMLTHTNVLANLEQIIHPELTHYASPTGIETMYAVLPMFHAYGMTVCLFNSIAMGSKLITFVKFDPKTYGPSLSKYKPTHIHVVPPILNFMVHSSGIAPEDLESVKTIVCGAAPMGETLLKSFRKKFPYDIVFQEGYGMTELSPAALFTHGRHYLLGSIGKPVPCTLAKIVHLETGASIAPGEGKGELCIKGPQVMKGYFKNPTATAEIIDADGWLHTGDVARVDAEGNTFIVDRMKELIKVKGFQVAPAELEDLLRSCPGVVDAAVIGIPDDKAGELPRAYIVKDPKDDTVTDERVQQFMASKTAAHKQISGGIVFMDVIPKNPTGKILRKVLKEQALKELNSVK